MGVEKLRFSPLVRVGVAVLHEATTRSAVADQLNPHDVMISIADIVNQGVSRTTAHKALMAAHKQGLTERIRSGGRVWHLCRIADFARDAEVLKAYDMMHGNMGGVS